MSKTEDARICITIADKAHEIERAALSIAEQLRRGEDPDTMSVMFLNAALRHMNDCLAVVLPDTEKAD